MIKMLVCDFDGTIDGGPLPDVSRFSDYVNRHESLLFVIATGRTFSSLQLALRNTLQPQADMIISDVGTQIHHQDLRLDTDWKAQLNANWDRTAIVEALLKLPFLGQYSDEHQGEYKITYEGKLSDQHQLQIKGLFQQQSLAADITYSHDWFLDITPKGITKATAIQHLMQQHHLSSHEICVAGDSANDTSMLTLSGVNGILVANHYQEVSYLSSLSQIYTSQASHSAGVLEGLQYWQQQSEYHKAQ